MLQRPNDLFRVMDIHLAAEGFDIEGRRTRSLPFFPGGRIGGYKTPIFKPKYTAIKKCRPQTRARHGTVLDGPARISGTEELRRATDLVRTVMPPTPTYSWPLLNASAWAEVWVKRNHSPVGAFKLRGATLHDWLSREQPALAGVVAATRGNHGQGVGLAARRRMKATIVVPHGNSREKNNAMQALGAELIEHGDDFQAALEYATELAAQRGLQGTILRSPARSRYRHLRLGDVRVRARARHCLCPRRPGLIDLRSRRRPRRPGPQDEDRRGCGFSISRIALSFTAGSVVPHAAGTKIADGLACRLPVAQALDVILKNVDRFVEVSEEEIASAMRAVYEDTHNVAEGAAAAAIAAVLTERDAVRGKRVARYSPEATSTVKYFRRL